MLKIPTFKPPVKPKSETEKLIGINTGELNKICKTDLLDTHPQEIQNILVVDDEDYILNVIRKVLGRAEYKVQTTESPKEALQIIKDDTDKKIDLVITDIIMPEMNGAELVSHIRQIRNDISILFISGNKWNVEIDPNDPFLEKPFRVPELLSAVKKIEMNKSPENSYIETNTPVPEEVIKSF